MFIRWICRKLDLKFTHSFKVSFVPILSDEPKYLGDHMILKSSSLYSVVYSFCKTNDIEIKSFKVSTFGGKIKIRCTEGQMEKFLEYMLMKSPIKDAIELSY